MFQDLEPLDPLPAVTNAAHMIGHMLGLQHDHTGESPGTLIVNSAGEKMHQTR